MKGQYLSLEYVIFFGIGIAMIIGIYFLFSEINESTRQETIIVQYQKIGNYILSGMQKVFISGNLTGSNIILDLEIPSTLSGSIYSIKTGMGYLYINNTNTGEGVGLNLYGIETKDSLLFSSNGKVKISYSNGLIELMQ